ncbi:MAG: nucleoside hydrolase [Planctomycetes bacterium]|nr:nucleoside hydrolase [Planctomycetota bacterium]
MRIQAVVLFVGCLAGQFANTATNILAAAENRQPVPIIFDTDIQGDADDVGAVAMLHALADGGEARILAMGVSCKNPWSPLCLDALNTYYGRPQIPLGVVKGPAFYKRSKYARTVAEEFPHRLKSADDAPDAAILYRQVLAKQVDASVVLVSVGQLTNFRNLLKTDPDDCSDLTGVELVKCKVRVWVSMGGKIPEGREANFVHDGPAAEYAVSKWPTPIIFSGYEIGKPILTGGRYREKPRSSPARRAFELFNGLRSKASFDQTAVLYAVRGLNGGLADFWDLESNGYMHVLEDGSNEWRPQPDKNHAYLIKKMQPARVAEVIEDLMLESG